MTHVFETRVHYEDTDLSGVVYHANYLKFIERARSDWVRGLGVDQNALREQGLVFVVHEIGARFHAPARLDDVLRVETRPVTGTGARMVLDQQVFCGDRRLFAAQVTLVAMDLAGRARRLPQGLAVHINERMSGKP
jgi:acyl-CoA thioester hydrolase